jgi:hypothetical protein
MSIEFYRVVFGPLPSNTSIKDFQNLDNPVFTKELTRIKNKYKGVFKYEGEYVIAALTSFWNTTHGFGNCNFRFFYLQFMANDPKFKIDGIEKQIEFNYNPVHRHDVRLLEQCPEFWRIMQSMYDDPRVMMSWDSQKIRFYDTGRGKVEGKQPGKPSMTLRHHDIYEYGGVAMDRLQAMLLMQQSNAISLGYVPFSKDKKIMGMVKEYMGYEKSKFGSVEDPQLNKIIDKYWRTIQNGFVIWNQETIHYEGIPLGHNFIRTYNFNSPEISHLSSLSFRAVIGVHTPIKLTQKALKQLCYLSEHGFLPEVYKNKKNNEGTPIHYNLVNAKGTQYLVPRQMTDVEKEILDTLQYDDQHVEEYINKLSPIVREIYGIYY